MRQPITPSGMSHSTCSYMSSDFRPKSFARWEHHSSAARKARASMTPYQYMSLPNTVKYAGGSIVKFPNMGKDMDAVREYLRSHLAQCTVTEFPADDSVDYREQARSYFPPEDFAAASAAGECIGMLLAYVSDVMQSDISHINSLEHIDNDRRLVVDAASLRHLEITQNVRDGGRRGAQPLARDRRVGRDDARQPRIHSEAGNG